MIRYTQPGPGQIAQLGYHNIFPITGNRPPLNSLITQLCYFQGYKNIKICTGKSNNRVVVIDAHTHRDCVYR